MRKNWDWQLLNEPNLRLTAEKKVTKEPRWYNRQVRDVVLLFHHFFNSVRENFIPGAIFEAYKAI